MDFVTVIKFATAETGNCIQVGKFNFLGGQGERCSNYFDWPSNWNENATSGANYVATVDVSTAAYSWSEGDYTICFGDGNTNTYVDSYDGTITFADLVTEQSIPAPISQYGETLDV